MKFPAPARPWTPQSRPLRAALRPLANYLSTGGMILAYHGLWARGTRGTGSVHVAIDRLTATVRAVSTVASFVPLSELVARHRSGKSTRGLAALTFDDAYASVASEAGAIVRDLRLPVTLFVVANSAESGVAYWWDRIDEVFGSATPSEWRAFEEACGLPASFRAGQPVSMGRLRPFRQWILAEHCGRWPATLEQPLQRLEAALGCGPRQHPLTYRELDALADDPLVEIGVHTLSHPVLPLLSDADAHREIRSGFEVLRDRWPRTLPILSIPFGLYDVRTARIAEEAGMVASLTLGATLLHDRAPHHLLPRICMTAGHRPWASMLFALGCWRGIRPRSGGTHRYPALPSPTS